MTKSGTGFRLPPGSTISIEQALKNKAASNNATSPNMEKPMTKPSKFAGAIAEVMSTQPANVTPLSNRDADEVHDGFTVLSVDEIDTFDGNVRLQENPERESIKSSIRQNGFRGSIEVTRRPGTRRWIVSAGGNTRLDILKELFAETGEIRFGEVKVTTKPYESEVSLLVNHITENDSRGDTTFWERATGYAKLKAEFEAERGKTLTVRDFEEAAKQRGISVSKSMLAYSRFAVDRLNSLSPPYLLQISFREVKEILQPSFNQIRALSARLKRIDEDTLRAALDNETEAYSISLEFRQPDATFSSQALALRWIDAGAKLLGSHRAAVQAAIHFMEQPDLDATDEEIAQMLSRPVQSGRQTMSGGGPASSPITPKPPRNAGNQDDPSQALNHRDENVDDIDWHIDQVQFTVTTAANALGVKDCLRLQSNLPAGFFMELPESALNSSLLGNVDGRYYGWYVLSYISGQRTFRFVDALSDESAWKAMMLNDTLDDAQDNILGLYLGGEITLRTMLFSDMAGQLALIELIAQVRALRDVAPGRFQGFAENRID